MYTYKAHVTAVYDADTITVDIDLGFDILFKNQKIRLFGINAPEIKGVEHARGVASRDALRSQILDKDIIIETVKDEKEKYGRYKGKIIINGLDVNQWLVDNQFAVFRDYE